MLRVSLRLEATMRAVRPAKVDALLVTNFTNVTYLSGFTGDDSALLVMPRRAILISDGRYTTQLQEECPTIEHLIRPVGQPLMVGAGRAASKLGIRRLGFESGSLTVSEKEKLDDEAKSVELVGLLNKVEELRMIKDKNELAAIAAAVDSAQRAFAMLRASLRTGQSEKDISDRLETYIRDCGATAASFPPIIAVGKRAALPHARPTAEAKIGDADFVLIDWGATRRLYKSDLTRVLVTGKVTSKFEKIYKVVLEAQKAGIDAIRPGVSCREVDARARAVIAKAGLGRYFDHGLGHGLGIDIHESPRLRNDCEITLQPGMVVTVEPGVYLPDWGGVRIEDDVLVTPDGREVLTNSPRRLDEIVIADAA